MSRLVIGLEFDSELPPVVRKELEQLVAALQTYHSTYLSGTNTGDQTITLTQDVMGSGTSTIATTITADAVTYAKMQNVSAASRLLGRGSASGAGDPEELTVTSPLAISGTALGLATGFQGIQVATVTLTNAQIKALPTTPIPVVPVPGAGFRIKLFAATIDIDSTAGAYATVNTTYASLQLQWTSGAWASTPVYNENSTSVTELTTLLTAGANQIADLVVPFINKVPADDWPAIQVQSDTVMENLALEIAADNNGSGNFTGGHASNTGKVTAYFIIEAII